MKFFVFGGGLGNQLFQYSYYRYLKKKYPSERILGIYPDSLKAHNGIEIDKWFDIELPPTSYLYNKLGILLYRVNRFLYNHGYRLLFCNRVYPQSMKHFFQWGDWQDYSIIKQINIFEFRSELPIGKENMEFLKKMETCNSISVHIRRGDYLKTDLIHIYGGICTSKYYREAIKFMEQEVEEPFFFFFSDDCLYVETEFADIRNKIIISHNRDDRSFFDMYLMAHAKNMILANSTFSCWAAYLNRTAKIIITPDRWVNTDFSKLEAMPNEWIKIRV